MDYKRRVIIKRPDEEFGHVTNISTSLENLQRTVDGNIEMVTLSLHPRTVMICNEDGKLQGLERNFRYGYGHFHDVVVGTVIIAGVDGDDLADIPIDFNTWKTILKDWGN